MHAQSLDPVLPFTSPWTVAHQAPPSMGFSRQEYWSGLPFPSSEDLPDPGIKPRSPALQADSLVVKNLPAKAKDVGDVRDEGSLPGFLKSPQRKAWQPTPIFLPRESCVLRSLAGYSSWGHKKLDTMEVTCTLQKEGTGNLYLKSCCKSLC